MKLDLTNPFHAEIKGLMDKGLVVMFQHDDTKDTLLALTDKGEQVADSMVGDDLSDEDVEIFLKKAEKDLTNVFECVTVCK
jgi:hypothetical protein